MKTSLGRYVKVFKQAVTKCLRILTGKEHFYLSFQKSFNNLVTHGMGFTSFRLSDS